MKKRRHVPARTKTYTLLHEISASQTETLPLNWQTHQLANMWDGLALLKDGKATTDDWRICSDAVNLMETFITGGPWLDCAKETVEIHDSQGLLADAVAAMANALKRFKAGKQLRLEDSEHPAITAVLEDYAALIAVLPQRTMIRCHRLTEQRIHEILAGKRQPHDVEIVTA